MRFKFEKFPRLPSAAFPDLKASPVPVITVGLSADETAEPFYVLALIDSGAADTIFHGDIGRQIGLRIEDGPTAQHRGVGGQIILSHFHQVRLFVGGHAVSIYAGFCDQVEPKPGLLGMRGFFEHFKVAFDYRKQIIAVAPYQARKILH